MEVFKGINALTRRIAHPVVMIGNFDGVHLGHQQIIKLALEKAKQRRGASIAYTFRPHPQVVLKPSIPLPLLLTYDEKLEILESLGVDFTIEEPFSLEFSTLEPRQFFTHNLFERLGVEAIVVGYDFCFGRERHGHLDTLQAFCSEVGVELTIVKPQEAAGEVVSSSKIRQHLLSGALDQAERLLGRPFFYRGIVTRGEGRGRKIGFPTANLSLEDKLALPYGVYATWAIFQGKAYPSVTNVGVRPTFQNDKLQLPALIETHLLDTSLDLYGSTMVIQFVARLREEKKFSGIESLRAQILLDVQASRNVLLSSTPKF